MCVYIFTAKTVCALLLSSKYLCRSVYQYVFVSLCIWTTVYVLLHICKFKWPTANKEQIMYFCIFASVCVPPYMNICVCPSVHQQLCASLCIEKTFCVLYVSTCVCISVHKKMFLSFCTSANMCVPYYIFNSVFTPVYQQMCLCISV